MRLESWVSGVENVKCRCLELEWLSLLHSVIRNSSGAGYLPNLPRRAGPPPSRMDADRDSPSK